MSFEKIDSVDMIMFHSKLESEVRLKSCRKTIRRMAIVLILTTAGCTVAPIDRDGPSDEPYRLDCGADLKSLFHVIFRVEDFDRRVTVMSAERRLNGGFVSKIPIENYLCHHSFSTSEEVVCGANSAPISTRFSFVFRQQIRKRVENEVYVRLPNFSSAVGENKFSCKVR